jgi:regulator of nucleoside diphosphate kinase
MMTIHVLGSQMAAGDFRTCEVLLKSAEPGSQFERLLRRKIDGSRPVDDEQLDPLVVTTNSRVEFQIDDESPQTRILVGSQFHNGLVGLTLPITVVRGLVLLGLRQGQMALFEERGRVRTAKVRRVAFQPQAARFGRRPEESRQVSQAEMIDLGQIRCVRTGDPSESPSFAGRRWN